jgi:hypothetical protein
MMTSPLPLLPPDITVFERGWLSSNNILIRGAQSTALIDSGYATHAAQTVALVRAALGRPAARPAGQHPPAQRPLRWQRGAAGRLAGRADFDSTGPRRTRA